MILDDDELEKRLNSPSNLVNTLKERLEKSAPRVKVIPMPNGGRREGDIAIPPMVRALIGSLASEESSYSVADTFGVSQPTANSASRGLVGNRFDSALKEQIVTPSRRDEAHSEALDMLMLTMNALKPKLQLAAKDDSLKAKDLSRIATDMAKVAGSMHSEETSKVSNLQVVIMAPPQKKESDYEYLEA